MAADRHSFLDDIHNNHINCRTRTIYVHSEHETECGEHGVSYNMSARFIKNLDHLNSVNSNDITIKFQTCGGDWNYGMAMYDAIAASSSNTTAVMYAHSRSMSSIIPQAATRRLIHKHCDFMIHYGEYADSGDLRKVFHGVEHYKKANKTMIEIYAERCFGSPFCEEKGLTKVRLYNFFERKMNEKVDWWLSADEAVYYGFMDEVIE